MPVSLEEEEDLLSFDVGAVITKAAAEQETMYVCLCGWGSGWGAP